MKHAFGAIAATFSESVVDLRNDEERGILIVTLKSGTVVELPSDWLFAEEGPDAGSAVTATARPDNKER